MKSFALAYQAVVSPSLSPGREGQRLEAVRDLARDIDRLAVVLVDVERPRDSVRRGLLAPVEDHDPGASDRAEEEVVLPALVPVEAADHALLRDRDVRLQ